MSPPEGSIGRANFVERHGLWNETQSAAGEEVLQRVEADGLDLIRISFADQHGILRGKSIVADGLSQAMQNGCTMTTTLLAKDTSHRTVFPVWSSGAGFNLAAMTGAGDFLMVPDPTTFRVLPWAERTGWMLSDIYFPDGTAVPFSTRRICAGALEALAEHGYDYMTGLEIEFHIFRLEDPKLRPEDAGQPAAPPEVSLLAHGYQYLTENRMDELEPVLELLRRDLMALDLPIRSIEVEFGPSQCEFTFHPRLGLETADNLILFRSAVKQICRRHGYHASFMCRPNLPNLLSCGWHLHQSLVDRRSGNNAFMPVDGDHVLSPLGQQFLAGLLAHAPAACVFTTPTINGYKRYRPYSLAPERVLWGHDNKGAMIRALGMAGDPATRLENRVGESAANPYLCLAAQLASGLDGIERELPLPPASDQPYDSDAPLLPRSLIDALAALRESALFRAAFGAQFVDYMLTLKEAEVSRFLSEVTDWEQREYFEIF